MELNVHRTNNPQHRPFGSPSAPAPADQKHQSGQEHLIRTTRTPNPNNRPFILGLVLGCIGMFFVFLGVNAGYKSLITTCKTPSGYTSVENKTAKDSNGNDLFVSRGYYSDGSGVPGSNIALLFSFCGSVDPSLKPVSDLRVNINGAEVVLAKAVVGGMIDGGSSNPLALEP